MASLVESGKHGAINTTYTSTNGFYVIMFKTGAYTLQENTTIDGQIITAGELFFKAKISLFYAKQHQLVLESTTKTSFHHSANTHNTSSKT